MSEVVSQEYGVVYSEGGPGLVQVLRTPMAAPFKCAVCGSGGGLRSDGSKDPRVFIDFNFTVDYYGQVIFCSECIVVVANSIGYLSPEQAEQLRTHIEYQQNTLISLKDQNVKLRASIASLVSFSNDSVVSESVDAVVTNESGPENSDEESSTDEFTIDLTESKVDESTSEQGPNDLPGPTTSFGPSGLLDL